MMNWRKSIKQKLRYWGETNKDHNQEVEWQDYYYTWLFGRNITGSLRCGIKPIIYVYTGNSPLSTCRWIKSDLYQLSEIPLQKYTIIFFLIFIFNHKLQVWYRLRSARLLFSFSSTKNSEHSRKCISPWPPSLSLSHTHTFVHILFQIMTLKVHFLKQWK